MPSPDRESTGKLSRRDFLKAGGALAGSTVLGALAGCASPASPAEAGPTPLPTVPARKTPELPFATPVSIPKRVDATPIPEVEGITIGGLRGVVVEGNFGGGADQSPEFAQAQDASPIHLVVTDEDGNAIAGYNTTEKGKMLAFIQWDSENEIWNQYGTNNPFPIMQIVAENGANMRSILKNKGGKQVGQKPITVLSKGKLVAVVPGFSSFPAKVDGKSYNWSSIFRPDENVKADLTQTPEKIVDFLTAAVVTTDVEEIKKPVVEVVQEEAIEDDKIWLSKTQKELAAIAGSAKKLRTHNDLSVPLTPETLEKDDRGITYIRFNAILLELPQIQKLSSVPGYQDSEYGDERYDIRAYTAPILWQHPNGRYAVTRIILGMDGAGDASFKDIDRKGVLIADNGVIPFTEKGTTVYVRDLVATIPTNAQHIFQVTVGDGGVSSILKEMFERQKGYGKNAGDDSKRLVDLRTRCTASLIQTYGARAIEVVNSSTEREDLQTLPIAGVLAKLTVNTA